MGEKITVWTKQHKGILDILEKEGRYIAKREYIAAKMEDHSALYFDVYNWYISKAKALVPKPADVEFPVWVALTEGEKLQNTEGNVQLELEVNASDVIVLDIDKWGQIVNYMYIPKDEEDKQRHEAMLARYGTDDCTAYMSNFFPSVKREIVKSWDRLFDDTIRLSPVVIGTIWEIRSEWVRGTEKG